MSRLLCPQLLHLPKALGLCVEPISINKFSSGLMCVATAAKVQTLNMRLA